MTTITDCIRIEPDGALTWIYADDHPAAALVDEALETLTRRASHVEPAPHPETGAPGWRADMAPSGGPLLAWTRTRAESLRLERAHLLRETLNGGPDVPPELLPDFSDLHPNTKETI